MSSERGRAVLIFGVVGAIAAGAGYYFFEVYRPNQVARDARAEVTAWEPRWASARGCLLGASPGSPKTSEALAIHELAPDPWDRGACTGLMSKLVRGDAPDTGLRPVEAAWRQLDHAATKAAGAFAEHVASPVEHAMGGNDPLPAALDALDAARAALRASVGLPTDAQTIAPLPVAQAIALADGANPVTRLDIHGPASARGLVVFGATESKRGVQVALPTGGVPVVSAVPEGAARGVPDATWAAAIAHDALDTGAVDGSGTIAHPAATAAPKIATIAAVVGSLAAGTVVYGTSDPRGNALGVAHVANGAVTLEPTVPVPDGFTVIDPTGTGAVIWNSGVTGDRYSMRAIAPSGIAAPVTIPGPIDVACAAEHGAWLAGDSGAFRVDGTAVTPHPDAPGELLACQGDAALFRPPGDDAGFLVCTDTCHPAARPAGAPSYAALVLVDGKLVGLAANGDVLGVWRGGAPAFYALPHALALVAPNHAAATDGKVIDALAVDGAHRYSVVRIPAR